MEAKIKPTKIQIYVNTSKKTIAQVKSETGCDYIINGGLFNWNWSAACWLKVNGKRYASESWKAWGYGWNGDISNFCVQLDDTGVDNFINCVCMVKDGVKQTGGDWSYGSDMGGSRPRTAWAIMPDGSHYLYASTSGKTPEQLRDYFYNLGAKQALMMDGGGSTQCIFPQGKVSSSRVVYDYICFWVNGNTSSGEGGSGAMEIERPTGLVKQGDTGPQVAWVQTQLNKLGNDLDVDGIFGSGTYTAVVNFQNYYSLDVDGIVGTDTVSRMELAEKVWNSSDKLVKVASKYIETAEPSGDDEIIERYNKLAGTSFGLSTSWCQMFAVVCQDEAGITPYITASCTDARNHYKSTGQWVTEPVVGRLIYFDWDLSGDCDHVGIVAYIDGNTVYTIEGNASSDTYDGVCFKNYSKSYSRIAGYADVQAEVEGDDPEPDEPEDEPVIPSTPTEDYSNKIKIFQKFCKIISGDNITEDGIFGSATKKAALKVLQKYLNTTYNAGLDVDGIWGPKTQAAVHNIYEGEMGHHVYVTQGMLYCRGYNPEELDGYYGNGTVEAVKKHQTDYNLTVDGAIGPLGMSKLFM